MKIALYILSLCVLVLLPTTVIQQNRIQRIESWVSIEDERIQDQVNKHLGYLLTKVSLETMRYEIDSLKTVVWAGNELVGTVYDLVAPPSIQRYINLEGEEVDTIIANGWEHYKNPYATWDNLFHCMNECGHILKKNRRK